MDQVVLLNADYTPLGVISWRKAVRLIYKGKAEIVKYSTRMVTNVGKTFEILLPEILRLIKLVRSVWRSKVPLNKRNILVRDAHTCQYCGRKSNGGMSIDHIVPRSKGGKSTWDNMVACCTPCNCKKDDRLPTQAGMRLLKRPTQPTVMEHLLQSVKNSGLEGALVELGLL